MTAGMESPYRDGRALRQAVKAAAAASGAPETTAERMQQFWFDRFLCRVFTFDEDKAWTLKGGVGLLSRVQRARSTQDIDFTVADRDISTAVADLRRMASLDLEDHLVFEMYRSPTEIIGQGEDVAGKRVHFVGRCGGHEVTRFHVDVVIAPPPVGEVSVLQPQNRAQLSRVLPVTDYRVFPIEDHLAEKAVAALAHAHGDENTRVRDLVDIVIIGRTQTIDRQKLREALEISFVRAGEELPETVSVPEQWRGVFTATAAGSMLEDVSFDDALAEARRYLEPVLRNDPAAPASAPAESDRPGPAPSM